MHKSDTTLAQRKFEYSGNNLSIHVKNSAFLNRMGQTVRPTRSRWRPNLAATERVRTFVCEGYDSPNGSLMPRKTTKPTVSGKAELPQISAKPLEELIHDPFTKEQFIVRL